MSLVSLNISLTLYYHCPSLFAVAAKGRPKKMVIDDEEEEKATTYNEKANHGSDNDGLDTKPGR
jgi:hypothetical protein